MAKKSGQIMLCVIWGEVLASLDWVQIRQFISVISRITEFSENYLV